MLELNKAQLIFTIRTNGEILGHISSTDDGTIVTEGLIGEGEFESLVDLIHHLQGHNISIDDLYT